MHYGWAMGLLRAAKIQFVLAAAALMTSGCVTGVERRATLTEASHAPPPPPEEASAGQVTAGTPKTPPYAPPGKSPGADWVWVRGYWHWDGVRHVWKRGRWERSEPDYVRRLPR